MKISAGFLAVLFVLLAVPTSAFISPNNAVKSFERTFKYYPPSSSTDVKRKRMAYFSLCQRSIRLDGDELEHGGSNNNNINNGNGFGGGSGENDDEDDFLDDSFVARIDVGDEEISAITFSRHTASISKFLLKFEPWKIRLIADNALIVKLCIEICNGAVAQVIAEYEKRRDNFLKEFDIVLADVLTSCFANFAAIWVSCPTVRLHKIGASSFSNNGLLCRIKEFIFSCPGNAFQKVMLPAENYTAMQRCSAILIPMPKLFTIGFLACAAGYGLTNFLMHVRRLAHPSISKINSEEEMPIFKTSIAIGVFLAFSSNLRYQFIAGVVEQRFFGSIFASSPALSNMGSMLVRTCNLYLGASLLVDWLRLVNTSEFGILKKK